MLERNHPRLRGRKRVARRGAFHPTQVSAVAAMYSMPASTAVAGEWQTIVDVKGGASMVQNDTDRRMAVGAAANGLPTGVYDGTDCTRMPLGANNFNTSKFGWSLWRKSPDVSTVQDVFTIFNNDATVRVMECYIFNGRLNADVFIGSNIVGRTYQSPAAAVSVNVFQYVRFQFDMTKTNEFDATGSDTDAKVRFFVGETALALTGVDFGAPGPLTVLRTPSGSAIWGGTNDTDTPGAAQVNNSIHGPNSYIWLDTPTAAQATAVMNYDKPT